MDEHQLLFQQRHQPGVAVPQVLDPDRRIDQNHGGKIMLAKSHWLGPPSPHGLKIRHGASEPCQPTSGFALDQGGQSRAKHRGGLLQAGVRLRLGEQIVVKRDSRAHRRDPLFSCHQD
jgi:hypothetical protein